MANDTAPPTEGYTVVARRYRPQTFTELVGQESVARALENALKTDRVAHAYLFTGPRGVGKTSTARILAKALNCVHGPTTTPCGECEVCRGIASGEDVDVLEIDGASNNRVDEARELRSNVQYRPTRARFKIYIIDEVHMLSTGAFNALLKTLEEPPPHVKFILATTEVQKIPVTILSRCQRFDFSGISPQQIVGRLQEIVDREKRQAEPEALELVARRAGGSMRDAQSLLDQLLSFGGETLTAEQVYSLLGTAADDWVIEVATAVLGKDASKALDLLGQLADRGVQMGELVDQLLAYWRDLMVAASAGARAPDLNTPPRHRDTLQQQAKTTPLDTILAGLDILGATRQRLPRSNHGRLLVEMALVRLARLDNLASISQLIQWASQPHVASSSPAAPVRSPSVSPPEGVKKNGLTRDANGHHTELNEQTLPHLWQSTLTQVGRLFAADLEKAGLPAIAGPNALVLRFSSEYNREREFCQVPERLAKVEDALRKLTGKPCALRVEASLAAAPPSEGNKPAAVRDIPTASILQARSKLKEEVEKDPLIRRVIELLDASVFRVEDGFGQSGNGDSSGGS